MNNPILNYQLIALEAKKGQIIVIDPNDYTSRILIESHEGTLDGIVFDPHSHLFYWTNMGKDYNAQDGYIQSCTLTGKDQRFVVKRGDTHTPKQIKLDLSRRYLYWCDREGMMIERCEIKTGKVEVLLDTQTMFPKEDPKTRQCVGIALDIKNNRIFWTMKGPSKGGMGRLLYAPFDYTDPRAVIKPSQLNIIYDHLPEPIDLEIDYAHDFLYWTDRGAEPNGNSLNRLKLSTLSHQEIVVRGFKETIGLTIDSDQQLAFVSDKTGHIYRVDLQTQEKEVIYRSEHGEFTGLINVNKDE